MTAIDRIRNTLATGLAPERLEVIDESALHAGHAGGVPGKTTHVRVRVVSAAFSGKSRIERHRLVNNLMAPEIEAGLHALAIEARAPEE
jgi:BolA protein